MENLHGTYQLIQGKDFSSSDNLNYDSLTQIIPERKPELYTVTKDDILFQARGTNHFAYCIETYLNNILAGNSFYIIRPDINLVLPQYLSWFLKQRSALDFLKSEAGGSIISFISKSTLGRLKIEIPSIGIQKKIVAVQRLSKREEKLRIGISNLKSNLINTVCLRAAYNSGDMNE